MEPIHPDKMVPGTKYYMETPTAVSLAKLLNRMDMHEEKYDLLYKTVTFRRVAYRLNGTWYYLFHADGKKRYFTSDNTFYKTEE